MSRLSDGAFAVYVENTRARRGSRLAAARSPCTTLAMEAGSAPSRFSNWNSKPPLVDRPITGGRLKGKTIAVRICCAALNNCAIDACTESAVFVRSSKGRIFATKNALLLAEIGRAHV